MALTSRTEYNEYMKKYMLKRYHERRIWGIAHLGSECWKCGSKEGLEFDHIDWRDKSFSIGKLWSVSEKRFKEEIKKCQLLCNDCHKDKTRSEGHNRRPITHGLYWAAYKHKCRCSECDEYRKIYNARRREKRKARAGNSMVE